MLRTSKIRSEIVKLLQEADSPLSVDSIRLELKHKNLWPNKTTVYRALETLLDLKEISEVDFLDGKKRYETIDKKGHHHHLVCQKCGKVICVGIELEIHKIQTKLEKETSFQIKSHSMEFFGLCESCRVG